MNKIYIAMILSFFSYCLHALPRVHVISNYCMLNDQKIKALAQKKFQSAGYELTVSNDEGQLPSEKIALLIIENPSGGCYARFKGRVPHIGIMLWEPPAVLSHLYDKNFLKPFELVFTWDDTLVNNDKFFKINYFSYFQPIAVDIPFKDRKFACLMNANKTSRHPYELYSERKRVIEFFERVHPGDLDLYGNGWGVCGYKSYKGNAADKIATVGSYKFNFAYENIYNIQGYISEKILDTFLARTVPIYWGAQNITQYIPAECFIDRRSFASTEALYNYLTLMTEEKYNAYLQAIDTFVVSREFEQFTLEAFVGKFAKDVVKYLKHYA